MRGLFYWFWVNAKNPFQSTLFHFSCPIHSIFRTTLHTFHAAIGAFSNWFLILTHFTRLDESRWMEEMYARLIAGQTAFSTRECMWHNLKCCVHLTYFGWPNTIPVSIIYCQMKEGCPKLPPTNTFSNNFQWLAIWRVHTLSHTATFPNITTRQWPRNTENAPQIPAALTHLSCFRGAMVEGYCNKIAHILPKETSLEDAIKWIYNNLERWMDFPIRIGSNIDLCRETQFEIIVF